MNIANKLTLLRMLMIPVFIFLLLNHSADQVVWLETAIPVNQVWAAVVFALASFTDFLDGYLARKYQLVTSFGAFFDPMADKLLVMAALILLVQLGSVPGWVVFIILARELMVTGLRVLIAQSNGKVMAAAMPGKIKTTTQMLAIICFLLQDMVRSVWGFSLANLLLYVCLFFTIYSGLEYFYHARFVFSDGFK